MIRTALALALAVAFASCGPKLRPPKAEPMCVGELCEFDGEYEFNCFCPEE